MMAGMPAPTLEGTPPPQHRDGRTPRALRRIGVAVAVAALVAAGPACSGETTSTGPGDSVAAPSSSPPPPATPTPAGPVLVPVGSTTVTLADEGRGRVLRTHLHYPAGGSGGPDAPAATGVFPLVLMAHGYRLPPEGYDPLLAGVAARGYIVAAPDFPHTSPLGDGNRSDLVNQPADLADLIDLLVAESTRPGSLLPGIARPDRVAVMGHSDGGLTAAALAYDDAYRDERVGAAVVMTGGAAYFPGNWSVPRPPPLLAVHGTDDLLNPPSSTDALVGVLPASVPRYLVRVQGGDHIGPYMGETTTPGLDSVIADFLDVHLQQRGELAALNQLRSDANRPPLVLAAE
jgi:dienelactone hydrolase